MVPSLISPNFAIPILDFDFQGLGTRDLFETWDFGLRLANREEEINHLPQSKFLVTHRKAWACCCHPGVGGRAADCIITTNGGNKRCGALSDMQSLIPTFANILNSIAQKEIAIRFRRLARIVGPLGAHLLKHQWEIRCFISIWGI